MRILMAAYVCENGESAVKDEDDAFVEGKFRACGRSVHVCEGGDMRFSHNT